MKNRFFGEGGRFISDILEMSESFNLKGYIVTVDIEKSFDSLGHSFILACLKKYGYGNEFIKWIKVLLECQKSCIIKVLCYLQFFKNIKFVRINSSLIQYYQQKMRILKWNDVLLFEFTLFSAIL